MMELIEALLRAKVNTSLRRQRQELERQHKIYMQVTVPNQLVELVRQAQHGWSFETEWGISVGADMRPKLCWPLTPEQVELIKATDRDQCQVKEFSYRMAEYKFTDDELSGVVLATIRFQDDSRGINLDYQDVPIKVRCTGKSVKAGRGWQLSSVEHL